METQQTTAGAVNFDSGIIPESEQQRSQLVEAQPDTDVSIGLGNARVLGVGEKSAEEQPAAIPNIHSITFELNLTLNNGLTFLRNSKVLRSIEIERGGMTERFNFYNPFMRADKDRNTGEGLLRKILGSIARIGHEVLGREAVFIGPDAAVESSVAAMAESVTSRMRRLFPVPADTPLFNVELDTNDGPVERAVSFGELFSLDTWTTVSDDDEAGITYHIVTVNIGMNVGALYDSAEPHSFVNKAYTFLDAQLQHLGIADVVAYHVNYSIPASELNSDVVRTAFDVLLSEAGYTVVSKAGVLGKKYDWIPSTAADKLFGYDCDLILRSPVPMADEDDVASE